MSAIHDKNPNYIQDITYARTRVKAVIHSHSRKEPLVLDQQIRSISTSKSIKSMGSMTLGLVPNENYLNRVFPNDYINLYVDRGDKDGWTRLFFGYIDRIQEDYAIDQDGKPNTSYTVHCSDFSKALEKSQIYFNPNILPDRQDFDSAWIGMPNLGGVALQTKGIAATGSPPDVLLNNLFVMLGASSQFLLPDGYMPRTKDKFRQKRAEFVVGRLQSDILKAVPNGMSSVDFLLQANKISQGKIPAADIGATLPKSFSAESRQAATEALTAVAKQFTTLSTDFQLQASAVLGTTASAYVVTLMDVMDCFTFVEREAIDGYSQDVTIWQKEGNIMSLLMQQSNEPINELFFDLRPTIDNDKVALAGGNNWSRTADEIGHNLDENLNAGIRYVPAVVFREYPFSTIDTLDASSIKLSLAGKDGTSASVGEIQFGAIFSDSPNTKGRHVIEVKNINVEDNAKGSAGKAYKHLDVAVIRPTEIMRSSFGRSDHEHFNLTQFITDGILGEASRFYMHDILPIINPVGIARHGLRVRELTSSFARFAEHNIPGPLDIAAPDDSDPTPNMGSSGSVTFPIAPASYNASSPYGWRQRPNGTPTAWIWHHGQDMKADEGTPVMAVADGKVVGVVPAGTPGFHDYGNVVVILHNDLYKGQKVFSLYAHLVSIDAALWEHNPQRLQTKQAATAKELGIGGKMLSFPITAGTVIGGVGNTNWVDEKGTVTTFRAGVVASHLHFEVLKRYPARGTGVVGLPASVPLPADRPPVPDLSALNSYDPKQFFLDNGVDIEREVFIPDGDDKQPEDTDNPHDNEDDLDKIDAPEASNPISSNVDNSKIRSQVARWALLDDHWYQHNIEYLSGTISMRGAPEIRVGYRLDIDDSRRPMSFYVEGVDHEWTFPDKMVTNLTLTRGQCNAPFPVYVLPYLKGLREVDVQRKTDSRLGKYFTFPTTKSARNGVFISDRTFDGKSEDLDQTPNPDAELLSDTATSGELFMAAGESLDLRLVGEADNVTAQGIVDKAKKTIEEGFKDYNITDKINTSNTKK
ncbi:MAG: outer rane adhesin like protein [Sphingomonadales bacterium]|nr:outer rane adhesin like protein [Sphingomonadales bacterium]